MAPRKKSAPRRTRPRGNRRAGVALAVGIVVALALGGLYLASTPGTPQLDQTAVGTIQQAISTVPTSDVGGADVANLPRPNGSIRSYYLRNAALTTVIYSQHGTVPATASTVQGNLAAAGWAPVGNSISPPSSQAWRGVYAFASEVAQVSVVLSNRVVSTTYIVQTSQQ
jgi:hypothetical protein